MFDCCVCCFCNYLFVLTPNFEFFWWCWLFFFYFFSYYHNIAMSRRYSNTERRDASIKVSEECWLLCLMLSLLYFDMLIMFDFFFGWLLFVYFLWPYYYVATSRVNTEVATRRNARIKVCREGGLLFFVVVIVIFLFCKKFQIFMLMFIVVFVVPLALLLHCDVDCQHRSINVTRRPKKGI